MKDRRTKAKLLKEMETLEKIAEEERKAMQSALEEQRSLQRQLKEVTEKKESLEHKRNEMGQAICTAMAIMFPGIDLYNDPQSIYHNGEYYSIEEDRDEDQTLNLLRHLYNLV